jgi:DNA-binding MarR family transcriptional regulator
MDRKASCREIMDLFIRVANKYNTLEKIPVQYGKKQNLYHSERHVLDNIGDNPGMNVTEFADSLGVTKGAISQVLKKLESKSVARRYKKSTNEKEVFIELTKLGKEIYEEHQKINEETIVPLCEELQKYPDENVKFLIDMFKWIDGFLDTSKEKMKGHSHQGC